MLPKTVEKIILLEQEIIQRGDTITADDAYQFYDNVCWNYDEFMNVLSNNLKNFSNYMCVDEVKKLQGFVLIAECMQKNTTRLQEMLKKYFPSQKVNQSNSGQTSNTVKLNPLLKKQKFYVQMIDSLAPVGKLSVKEAELQFEHVSQYYEKFIANQSEIMAVVADNASNGQVNFAKEIQRKVFSVQKSLKEILSPSKPSIVENSNGNLVDESKKKSEADKGICLNSLLEKQKSLMHDIESMKSYEQVFKSFMSKFPSGTVPDSEVKQVELSLKNLLKLKKWFVSNQAKIEELVSEYDLYKQKEISAETQTKLKKIQKEYEFYIAMCEYLSA